MTKTPQQIIIESIIEDIELPDSAYEKAIERYENITEFFKDPSPLSQYDPHIFPQGSFRIGTAIKPINPEKDYDVDLACKLRENFSLNEETQEELREIIKNGLTSFCKENQLNDEIIEKQRCCSIDYKGEPNFHLDIVPCIPTDSIRKEELFTSLNEAARIKDFAAGEIETEITKHAVYITDDEHPDYNKICHDWNISNPEGYALWFKSRMENIKHDSQGISNFLLEYKIDKIPTYNKRTPLQQAIQLLKRHRDVVFEEASDCKPSSIILSTLAARAYNGEHDAASAIENILDKMGSYVKSSTPRIANPVNPEEDFADRWVMPKHANKDLENNFWRWLEAAKRDFNLIISCGNSEDLIKLIKLKLRIVNEDNIRSKLRDLLPSAPAAPVIRIDNNPPKPWGV